MVGPSIFLIVYYVFLSYFLMFSYLLFLSISPGLAGTDRTRQAGRLTEPAGPGWLAASYDVEMLYKKTTIM